MRCNNQSLAGRGYFLFNKSTIRNHLGMRAASIIMLRVWITRFVLWYGVWLILAGWSSWNAVVGIPAAALATWAGMILLPAGRRWNFLCVFRYAVGFVWQSVVAGVDVAWRVFQPRMPLHPGIVRVAPRIPAGSGRLLFRAIASLQPGSLACGVDDEGYLLFHCLDTREDVEGVLSRAQDELAKLWQEEKQ
jgi:multicomponent Na+:H+ antiporter subunit E